MLLGDRVIAIKKTPVHKEVTPKGNDAFSGIFTSSKKNYLSVKKEDYVELYPAEEKVDEKCLIQRV